jgi:hypothetical protein
MAQSKKTSFVVKESLNKKSSYVFANVVPSGFFNNYINIEICIKNGTGPKRLTFIAAYRFCQFFFLYAFGAFFQHAATHKGYHIKSRRGTGAIFRKFTSFCYYCWLIFVTKKSVIVSRTFAVSFFLFLRVMAASCIIQTKKKLKMEVIG